MILYGLRTRNWPRLRGHPLYEKLNELLDGERFDAFVEALSAGFYASQFGRPSLLPGVYFRSLLIGYFEGIEGERGIAWRVIKSGFRERKKLPHVTTVTEVSFFCAPKEG
jgi:transposase